MKTYVYDIEQKKYSDIFKLIMGKRFLEVKNILPIIDNLLIS